MLASRLAQTPARGAAEPLLAVESLSKTYTLPSRRLLEPRRVLAAVDGIDLTIAAGETLGLVGESGCGKTTLGRMIARLEEPSSGAIRFAGRDIRELDSAARREYRRSVQIVFQNPYSSLNPRKTIGFTVEEPLAVFGVGTRAERRARAMELLELVGLQAAHHSSYPHEFSGGQRQRICIARALALQPRLIVCDEPVSALDVSIRSQIINLLIKLQHQLGLSYLFISHDLGVVRHVSDRVAVMYKGRIVELAPVRAVYEQPRHPYTRALLAAIPAADPNVDSFRTVIEGGVSTHGGEVAGCRFSDRCPFAVERCRAGDGPPLEEIVRSHFVRCWRVRELPEV